MIEKLPRLSPTDAAKSTSGPSEPHSGPPKTAAEWSRRNERRDRPADQNGSVDNDGRTKPKAKAWADEVRVRIVAVGIRIVGIRIIAVAVHRCRDVYRIWLAVHDGRLRRRCRDLYRGLGVEQPHIRRLIEAGPTVLGSVGGRIRLRRGTSVALDGSVLEDQDALHLLPVDDDRLDDALLVGRCLGKQRRRKAAKHVPISRNQLASTVSNVDESTEAVDFQFVDEVSRVEWLRATGKPHGAEVSGQHARLL